MPQPPVAGTYDKALPRALTDRERRTLVRVADALIPEGPAGPPPSKLADYQFWLDRALAARRDSFESIMALAQGLADVPRGGLVAVLRRISGTPASGFEQLSAVVAGAYLLVPDVRQAIGYPGQAQRPPRFDEAAEEIMSGILEPVIARGAVYRAVGAAGVPSRAAD